MLKKLDYYEALGVLGGIDYGAIKRIGEQREAEGSVVCKPIDFGTVVIYAAGGALAGARGGVAGVVLSAAGGGLSNLADQAYHSCSTQRHHGDN